MNILPKKNWHVRKKENIARVQADEAKAAEEEKETQRKLQLAEQQARTTYLRQKARDRKGLESSEVTDQLVPTDQKALDLFEDVSEGKNVKQTNEEYEKEKKEEQEKKEKAIGLLTYLGQSVLDAKGKKPWWEEPPEKKKKPTSDEETKISTEEWEVKKKRSMDPLRQMKKVEDQFRSKRVQSTSTSIHAPSIPKLPFPLPNDIVIPKSYSRKDSPSTSIPRSSTEFPHKEKKKKKHKKEKRKKSHKGKSRHRSHSSSDDDKVKTSALVSAPPTQTPSSKSGPDIERLRAERLAREKAERAREATVLQRALGLGPDPRQSQEEAVDDRSRPYNSAFHPELAVRREQSRKTMDDIVHQFVSKR